MYLVELELPNCVSVPFSPCFFLVLNKLGMAISTFILESRGLARVIVKHPQPKL